MPAHAPFALPGLLFTCLLLGLAGVAFVLALIVRNYSAARKVLAAGIIALGAYAALMEQRCPHPASGHPLPAGEG